MEQGKLPAECFGLHKSQCQTFAAGPPSRKLCIRDVASSDGVVVVVGEKFVPFLPLGQSSMVVIASVQSTVNGDIVYGFPSYRRCAATVTFRCSSNHHRVQLLGSNENSSDIFTSLLCW